MTIIHLVDDINYIETNCYQHQLAISLKKNFGDVKTVSCIELTRKIPSDIQLVISCLKQRTLFKIHDQILNYVGDVPFVVYDQDPWQAYMDDSPYKGTYDLLKGFNLKAIAVTTQWWSDKLKERKLPGQFVKMGMLPDYCNIGPCFQTRNINVGFIGTIHPRRAKLISELKQLGVDVVTNGNSYSYRSYIDMLHNINIFIHNEDCPIMIDGKRDNMGKGMWIKDVEAASRGCFSIRNFELGHDSYCTDIPTIKLYEDPVHARDLIKQIMSMDHVERNNMRISAVEQIKKQDDWSDTSKKLVAFGDL